MRGLTTVRKQTCLLDDLRVHRIEMMEATESKLASLYPLSHLLSAYEKIMSPYQTRGKGGAVVLYHQILALLVSSIFVDLEGKLVVLEITYSGRTFRLVGAYAPHAGAVQNDFFRSLETY